MAKKKSGGYAGGAGSRGARPGAASTDGAYGASGIKEQKPATLQDLLNPDTLTKLKAQADTMRAAEAKRKEEQRAAAEAARKAEQKRLDNDFGHLLKNSDLDWKKYK
jgi:hypothetical protein